MNNMHIATIFNVPKNYLVGNYTYVRNFVVEGWGGGDSQILSRATAISL